jgi:Transglutaminase-like superfamily
VVPNERKSESHIRPVEQMLDRILAIDNRPLTVARPPERRLVGVCRHFMVLLLALLRAKGIPARGRCGFGTYFNPGFFEDHVVCEYWRAPEERWVLVDSQFDEVWRARLKIDHDVFEVPRDRFLIAADGWVQCRAGKADPAKFGIIKGGLRGLWFIAANLVHDVATLNKVELLRWDSWGAMPRPEERLQGDRLAFFDKLAVLTREADESFEQLRRLYECDDRLRVPAYVFNSLLNQPEAISALGA